MKASAVLMITTSCLTTVYFLDRARIVSQSTGNARPRRTNHYGTLWTRRWQSSCMRSRAPPSSRSCGGFTGFATTLLCWMNISLLILVQMSIGKFKAYALTDVGGGGCDYWRANEFMDFNHSAKRITGSNMWLYTITPQHYPFVILGSLMFGQCDVDPTWNESTQA
ncbi:hypothetical protein F442_08475 [Phytophthora nicotianae P10297]|uniref:Uncharacterized protein n=1 Tax=Phytophthora nicotianae P10297 TaxID=1317064 RepID=W2ZCP4_PHYNI|nr:hypothetical protein F442_08475 [Phytophthora nicotianae P10297]